MFGRITRKNLKPSQRLLLNGENGESNPSAPETAELSSETAPSDPQDSNFRSEPSLDRERTGIIQRIRQMTALEDAFGTATEAVLSTLSLDRVLIYRFDGESEGQVVSEALVEGWTPAITELLPCILFGARNATEYRSKGLVSVAEGTPLSAHQKQLLAKFQVRSSLAIPILLNADHYSNDESDALDRVWGLLVLQQCSPGRRWTLEAINLLERVSTELTLSLQLDRMRLNAGGKQDILSFLTRQAQSLMQDWLQDLRSELEADRVLVYAYNPDWSGNVLAESVGPDWERAGAAFSKHFRLSNESFQASYVVDNVYGQGLTEFEIAQLETLQAKAYILVPIVQNGQLAGILGVYQNTSPRNWQETEVALAIEAASKLAQPLKQTEYVRHTQFYLQNAKKRSQQEQLIAKISERLQVGQNALPQVLKATARDIRELLGVDRVGLFQFSIETNYASGEFVVEDVSDPKYSAMARRIQDHCFVNQVEDYTKGKTWIVSDVRDLTGIRDCLAEILNNLQVKASILHPLMRGDELWGLFAIHNCEGPRQWEDSEIEFARRISLQLNLALQQAEYQEQLQRQTKQEQLIAKISERLQGGQDDLPKVLKATAHDIRELLDVDRVGLFQFSPDTNYASGEFVVEDVSDPKYSAMAERIQDHCFVNQVEDYTKGKTWIVNDVRDLTGIKDCLAEILEKLQVKASILYPLMKGDELWGLFAIHNCSGPRPWHSSEIELARRISLQLNLALQQEDYIARLKDSTDRLTETLEREKIAKEGIQQQAIDLLMAVQPATAGDLTVRAKVTEDEVGTIAAVYNTTLDSLTDLIGDVAQATQSIVTVASASSSSIEGLAGQAQSQLQQVEQAQGNIQAMVEATDFTSQNALKVSSAVAKATASVESGDTAMNETVANIMTIRDTVSEAVKRVERLSEASQKIAKVVNLIGGFANQTNLLALNAALEATRAGEYGKGFAVVADEVRNLAHQSADATTEVEKLVQEVQFETKHVAAAMEAGIQQVMEGSELVTETRTSLNDIVTATAEITQLVEGITQAADRQMQKAGSVMTEMSQVSDIASGTYEGSKDIVSTIEQLSNMVQELQARIGQFKVS